jgi:hypothetical protein
LPLCAAGKGKMYALNVPLRDGITGKLFIASAGLGAV